MEYKVYFEQEGEGCDYTIGCGLMVLDIEADSMEEAKEKVTKLLLEDYDDIATVEIYEINRVFVMDVSGIYKNRDAEEAQKEQEIKEKQERDQYELLKKKFRLVWKLQNRKR